MKHLVLIALLVLGSCGGRGKIWYNPSVSNETAQREFAECRMLQNFAPKTIIGTIKLGKFDMPMIESPRIMVDCMRMKGYR